MKKIRQILAIVGVVLLVALYGMTVVFALLDDPKTFHMLGASIAATVLIPVIIWVIGIFVRLDKKDKKKQ